MGHQNSYLNYAASYYPFHTKFYNSASNGIIITPIL